jgi:hypothetical protein
LWVLLGPSTNCIYNPSNTGRSGVVVDVAAGADAANAGAGEEDAGADFSDEHASTTPPTSEATQTTRTQIVSRDVMHLSLTTGYSAAQRLATNRSTTSAKPAKSGAAARSELIASINLQNRRVLEVCRNRGWVRDDIPFDEVVETLAVVGGWDTYLRITHRDG